MKKLKLLIICLFILSHYELLAQEEASEKGLLEISGSADIYYKYDFSGEANVPTSFASDQNSFSIGMLNLILSKEMGKFSFVGDVSLGPRSAQSLPPYSAEGVSDPSFNIQNLYVSYALSEKVSVTAGYMGTFVGYEVISPVDNFNYSTSYLFSYGPFQNAGLKFDFSISENVAFMVGVFNDWNLYSQNGNDISSIGAQLFLSPVNGWEAYFNFITGDSDGTEFDLTTTYQISDKLKLGLNAASWNNGEDGDMESKFSGVALYTNYAFTDAFALGLRGEKFSTEGSGYIGFVRDTGVDTGVPSFTGTEAEDVTSFTITGNIGSGPLKLIPELRLDSADKEVFIDADGQASKSAMQFLLAAVFSF
ncbi:outer membrane beta-barrel protein [Fulvivirgaceae bacterium BMA10]|uniref:Outer membrane beta-barrel protein n=1 Tax=Splendidivirga corallicola TaxID=3051826 RepID=A0ABT8KKY8_9BACT|nr:outer membrane beta-barrel protein [Fulvivirgaceae bacterium BMA10]